MTNDLFEAMSAEYIELCTWSEQNLQRTLQLAGLPPADNALHAVLANLRRVYGDDAVGDWLRHCAQIGVLV